MLANVLQLVSGFEKAIIVASVSYHVSSVKGKKG